MKKWLLIMLLAAAAPTFALRADINSDGRVDFLDLAILAEEWLMPERYGPELVVNGDFDGNADSWTLVGDWQYLSNEVVIMSADDTEALSQGIIVQAGKTYRVNFYVYSVAGGALNISLGGTDSGESYGNGNHSVSVIAGESGVLIFSPTQSGTTLRLDNISVKEVYDLCILTGIEDWAITKLKALTEYGNPLFRQDEDDRADCVDHWIGQLGMGNSGIESFNRFAPFAFVQAELERVKREGDYDANIRINLAILIGQKSVEEGLCRIGSADVVGANRMFEIVFTAFDGVHPGDGFTCDEFYLTDVVENINTPKKCGLQLIFSAHWIPVTT